MTAPALIAVAVLLAAAGVWELAGSRGEEVGRAARAVVAALSGGRLRTVAGIATWLDLPQRLERAGLAERVPVGAVLAGKLGGAGAGAMAAAAGADAVPGRLAIMVSLALPAAGFIAPEAILERAARRRRARLVATLPDALDLLAVGTAAGRSPALVLGEIAIGGSGPLAAELAAAVAEIECGTPQRDAIAALRDPGRGARAFATIRVPARRAASRAGVVAEAGGASTGRGAGCPGRPEDPARGRPRPGALGPADDPRCPRRPLGRALRGALSTPDGRIRRRTRCNAPCRSGSVAWTAAAVGEGGETASASRLRADGAVGSSSVRRIVSHVGPDCVAKWDSVG